MRKDKHLAFALRKKGKSYNEISDELGVAKSTLTKWFKGHSFSKDIKAHLTKKSIEASTIRIRGLNRVRGDTLAASYDRARLEAEAELLHYVKNPLFLTALVSYWGEGDKATRSHIRLSNTDPRMIKVFSVFLTHICSVPEKFISGALFLYEDLDEAKCKQFWKKEAGLQKFHKTMILPSRHRTKRLPYGTCSIIVTNTYLKHKLLYWIDHIPEIVLNTIPKK